MGKKSTKLRPTGLGYTVYSTLRVPNLGCLSHVHVLYLIRRTVIISSIIASSNWLGKYRTGSIPILVKRGGKKKVKNP